MYKDKKIAFFLLFCACCVFMSCSSENTPIAEVFLGDWEIFQKNEDNAGLVAATGEMNIDFGNEDITFGFSAGDEDNPVTLAGIVYNNNLYSNYTRQEKLGSLELTKSKTLIITIEKEEGQVVYHAR